MDEGKYAVRKTIPARIMNSHPRLYSHCFTRSFLLHCFHPYLNICGLSSLPGAVQNSLGTLMVLRVVLDEAGVKQVVKYGREERGRFLLRL